jgi:hypothetical protein
MTRSGAALERPRMPWKVRAVNVLGPLASRAGLMDGRAPFAVEPMLDEARQKTGLSDFGPEGFLPALEVLAGALDREARLTFHGRPAVRQGLVNHLANRLHLAENARRHPGILQVGIERPVFIIGLLRTGSTLLHNLLAQHPDLRVPLLWELGTPASPGADPAAEADLVRATQAYVDDYFYVAPRLKAVHFLDALRPDECHRLLGNAFRSMVFEMRYDIPSYARWLTRQDAAEAYRYHRQQLQHILWRKPGRPVVLKCPFHLWNLPALLAAYPDARLVHLHRDPARVIPSTCSLCVVVRGARAATIDLHGIGRKWLEATAAALDRLQGFRRESWPEARFLDVQYDELTRDTFGTLRRICDFAGAPLTPPARRSIEAWLARNPQEKHGPHRYTPEQFGLDPQLLKERFAGYRRDYGVTSEG